MSILDSDQNKNEKTVLCISDVFHLWLCGMNGKHLKQWNVSDNRHCKFRWQQTRCWDLDLKCEKILWNFTFKLDQMDFSGVVLGNSAEELKWDWKSAMMKTLELSEIHTFDMMSQICWIWLKPTVRQKHDKNKNQWLVLIRDPTHVFILSGNNRMDYIYFW